MPLWLKTKVIRAETCTINSKTKIVDFQHIEQEIRNFSDENCVILPLLRNQAASLAEVRKREVKFVVVGAQDKK